MTVLLECFVVSIVCIRMIVDSRLPFIQDWNLADNMLVNTCVIYSL